MASSRSGFTILNPRSAASSTQVRRNCSLPVTVIVPHFCALSCNAARTFSPDVVRQLQQRVRELEARLAAPANDNADALLDANDVARLLGLTPRAVRQAVWRGAIPFVR